MPTTSTKIAAAIAAGQGPDVVQLFYGWLDNFTAAKILQPLPADTFPTAKIEAEFFPIVQTMKRNGAYMALPTAVRSLAVFYNKKLIQEAGLDPENPPKTLDEMLAAARKMTKKDGAGNITRSASALDMGGQDQHWWREVLVRQFGGDALFGATIRRWLTQSEAGIKAFNFYTDLSTKGVAARGFMDEAAGGVPCRQARR